MLGPPDWGGDEGTLPEEASGDGREQKVYKKSEISVTQVCRRNAEEGLQKGGEESPLNGRETHRKGNLGVHRRPQSRKGEALSGR